MELFEEIFTKYSNENQDIKISNHPQIKYEKLFIGESFELLTSSLTQYFLAPFIFIDANGILDIPIHADDIQDVVLNEIAPHFNKVTKVTTNNQVLIRVQNIREDSKIHFWDQLKNDKINPIVNEIYSNSNGTIEWEDSFPIKEYKVNLKAVKKLYENDILPMWNFFERTFIKEYGNLVILPKRWPFDETFKDRVTVKSFTSVCNSMTVIVNQKNNLISSIIIN